MQADLGTMSWQHPRMATPYYIDMLYILRAPSLAVATNLLSLQTVTLRRSAATEAGSPILSFLFCDWFSFLVNWNYIAPLTYLMRKLSAG